MDQHEKNAQAFLGAAGEEPQAKGKKTLHLPRKALTKVVIPKGRERESAMCAAFAMLYGGGDGTQVTDPETGEPRV